MGCNDDVVDRQQRIVGCRRLLLQNVESRSCYLPGLQRPYQRRFINGRPTPTVNDADVVLHGCKLIVAQHAPGGIVQPRVNRDVIGLLQQFRKRHRLNAFCGHLEFCDIGVVGNHVHAEGFGPSSHGCRHVAERNQTERLAPDSRVSFQYGPSLKPVTAADHLVHLLDAPITAKQQHQGMIRHFFDKDVRHIGHDDAGFSSCVHVHHVHADAADADHRTLVQP